MGYRSAINWMCAAAFVMALVVSTQATDYRWTGGTGGNWSDASEWDVGGSYPSTKNDVGIMDDHDEQATYDASASGVCGGMQLVGRKNNQRIIIARDVLLDYTGDTGNTTTPAGWAYVRHDDTGTGSYPYINAGKTLTLTGLKAERGNYDAVSAVSGGGGTLKFQPDNDGKGYLYFSSREKGFTNVHIDFSDLTTIECMSLAGTGAMGSSLLARQADNNNSSNSRIVTIGRTDGTTQTFAGKASVAGTKSGARMNFRTEGMSGVYGPKLIVHAVGTEAGPNRIVFEKEALGGLGFLGSSRSDRPDYGCWIEAAGSGVARLVLEGSFITNDDSAVDPFWDMSQIQLQMAGEEPSGTPQTIKWCGADKHAGGTGDLFDFDGLTNANYAIRKLVIGSDEGTDDNYVTFDTSASGSAIYTWGLELKPGGYLTIANADDYIYYLGDGSEAAGITGGGLVGNLDTQCNRPENVFMLGEKRPPPGTIVIVR